MFPSSKFDENHVLFSFGVLSDWHIKDAPDQKNQETFLSAAKQLANVASRYDPNGLALLLAPGDLTHDGKDGELCAAKQTLSRVPALQGIPILYCVGNHDKHTSAPHLACHSQFSDWSIPLQDAVLDENGDGFRHFCVADHHFLVMDPPKYHKREPIPFSAEAKKKLAEALKEITSGEPHRYVFLLTHLPMAGTVYGSSRGYFYGTDDLLPILSEYPQVISISGHLHFPLNDERAIMQTDFTSVTSATLSNMLIDGMDCDNVRGTKTPNNTDFAQGLLFRIDAHDNICIHRLDFQNQSEITAPWFLDSPKDDRSHLCRYSAKRKDSFDPNAIDFHGKINTSMQAADDGNGCNLTLQFPSARYREPIRAYSIRIIEADTGCLHRTWKEMTDFYRYPQPSRIPQETTIIIPNLNRGKYTVSVAAQDCFGNESNPLLTTISVP